jgi:hypothetical protein
LPDLLGHAWGSQTEARSNERITFSCWEFFFTPWIHRDKPSSPACARWPNKLARRAYQLTYRTSTISSLVIMLFLSSAPTRHELIDANSTRRAWKRLATTGRARNGTRAARHLDDPFGTSATHTWPRDADRLQPAGHGRAGVSIGRPAFPPPVGAPCVHASLPL